MLFENFILRFLKLETEPLFFVAKTDEMMSFRANKNAMSVLNDLSDLLNTLLGENNGKFVVSLDMTNNCLNFKFVEANN